MFILQDILGIRRSLFDNAFSIIVNYLKICQVNTGSIKKSSTQKSSIINQEFNFFDKKRDLLLTRIDSLS